MPKYIIKPGNTVTHGSYDDAQKHHARMSALLPGQPATVWPAAPTHLYEEGDEIELTEHEAAEMPHALCTPEEWEKLNSPSHLMDKGYTREEAETMVASTKAAREARKAKRAGKAPRINGMSDTEGNPSTDPRTAGKLPELDPKHPKK